MIRRNWKKKEKELERKEEEDVERKEKKGIGRNKRTREGTGGGGREKGEGWQRELKRQCSAQLNCCISETRIEENRVLPGCQV